MRQQQDGRDAPSGRDTADADIACATAPQELLATIQPALLGRGERGRRLLRTVEAEVIPRLMMLRRMNREADAPPAAGGVEPPSRVADVHELARLLITHDFPIALAFVQAIHERGVSREDICLHLLAPAARLLGRQWEDDDSSFMQVTVGLCRLHQVLHRLIGDAAGSAVRPSEAPDMTVPRALLAGVPGEQHTFGIVIVGQFLRACGLDVWNEFPSSEHELFDAVREYSFDLVGLSVGSNERVADLSSLIRDLRRQSRNRDVCVMVGGPAVLTRPDLARSVGADATAADGREAANWVKARLRRPVQFD
jgi:methanogenic corrinoid protein MtbC1